MYRVSLGKAPSKSGELPLSTLQSAFADKLPLPGEAEEDLRSSQLPLQRS